MRGAILTCKLTERGIAVGTAHITIPISSSVSAMFAECWEVGGAAREKAHPQIKNVVGMNPKKKNALGAAPAVFIVENFARIAHLLSKQKLRERFLNEPVYASSIFVTTKNGPNFAF